MLRRLRIIQDRISPKLMGTERQVESELSSNDPSPSFKCRSTCLAAVAPNLLPSADFRLFAHRIDVWGSPTPQSLAESKVGPIFSGYCVLFSVGKQ